MKKQKFTKHWGVDMQKGVYRECFFVFGVFVLFGLFWKKSPKKEVFPLLSPKSPLFKTLLFSLLLFFLFSPCVFAFKIHIFSFLFVHQPLLGKHYLGCLFYLCYSCLSVLNVASVFQTKISQHAPFQTQLAFIVGCIFLLLLLSLFHGLCSCFSVFKFVLFLFLVLFCFLFAFQTMKNIVFLTVLVFLCQAG